MEVVQDDIERLFRDRGDLQRGGQLAVVEGVDRVQNLLEKGVKLGRKTLKPALKVGDTVSIRDSLPKLPCNENDPEIDSSSSLVYFFDGAAGRGGGGRRPRPARGGGGAGRGV